MPPLAVPPIVCFSRLRWGAGFERSQQLMMALHAHGRRVVYIEEPIFGDGPSRLVEYEHSALLSVVVPHLAHALAGDLDGLVSSLRELLQAFVEGHGLALPIVWYDSPLCIALGCELAARLVVYDCDCGAACASSEFRAREQQLFQRAQLVIVRGHGPLEAKRHLRTNLQLVPDIVDVEHFRQALLDGPEPADQLAIAAPRVGYAGAIDGRVDLELLGAVARMRPRISFVLLGSHSEIDASALPRADNLHYLGERAYADLPRYLGGWDVAILPFARNEATRFSSPTETAQYLAAGRPVVSTSIRDVVRPYAQQGLVRIADDPTSFARAIDLARATDLAKHRKVAATFLATLSCEQTALRIEALLNNVGRGRSARSQRIGRAQLG